MHSIRNRLSKRECDVFRFLLSGYSYQGIAERLFITKNTVKFHASNIYKKLNVLNRIELAAQYLPLINIDIQTIEESKVK
ncbi:LuxR C-terminal-related transcriptional regulator [Pseudoalteromonas fenneropenaei]|uniref:LuxR C-terminal-related transcriptional regulator n=2 Tax=Pseudoalteromonas fenneropenaei TaxID=1737459 RepID=A0ABV7CLH4_9GAMM